MHRDASERIVDLLVSAGRRRRRGAGPPSSASARAGPPLTPDDLLDLHVLLDEDDWFDDLVALVRRTTPE